MKKNKLLYILTILITLFNFNMNVKADDALTCVYKNNSDTQKKVALIKTGLGDYEVYTNDKGETIDGDNWIQQNYKMKINKITGGIEQEVKEKITVCPDVYLNDGNNITFFYGISARKSGVFLESHSGVKIIPGYLSKSLSGLSALVSCDTMKDINGISIDVLDSSKYQMSCIYAFDMYETFTYNNGYNDTAGIVQGCHVIQLDVNKDGKMYAKESYPFDNPLFTKKFDVADSQKITNIIENNNGGWCPSQIYVNNILPGYVAQINNIGSNYGAAAGQVSQNQDTTLSTIVSLEEKTDYVTYSLQKGIGYNWVTGEKYPDNDYNIHLNKIGIVDCDSLFEGDGGQHIKDILKFVIGLVKIFIPILLIGLGIFDFATAVFSGAEDKMKKAQEKFIKRVIIGVCLFLIPTIITFTLKLYNTVWDKNISTDFCGILD